MLKKLFCSALFLTFSFIAFTQVLQQPKSDTAHFTGIKIVPANYHAKTLGFFCKKELQLQKSTGINIFFRLGSKNYVDYLERKQNATKTGISY